MAVTVFMKSSSWIVGEYKECHSGATQPKQDIETLFCDDGQESHDLNVSFSGKPDTQNNRTWRCDRQEDPETRQTSLICKEE